ncbi:DUF2846 domain-containing protein [Parendozoicomonas haliclonae]|uniref:DUF2846 domain-containing protein n=1 Tax=Parendozoicomonas haliclonae TaxID=1960125 RepID=A0A1X7ADR1_9GAMM|nr:DUF2846 domain-containing protein [Parendozoicomonas haliclonae]SMA32449.1 hypothetical protein EHSB41UT_00152 [Parendozoicomonas haliclonae]
MIRLLAALGMLFFLTGCTWDRTLGAFFDPVDGPRFQAPGAAPEDRAYLVIYRPYSEWAEDELEAPSVYVNGDVAVNIKSNGYALFNLEPGKYDVVLKRPAFGQDLFFMEDSFLEEQPVNFNRIGGFQINAAGGQTYYLRYSELTSPPYDPASKQELLGDGPLQFVSWRSGKDELGQTRMLQPLMVLAAPEIVEVVEEPEQEEGSWWLFGLDTVELW